MRRRTEFTFLFFMLAALGMVARLVYLMAYRGPYFAIQAANQQQRTYVIAAHRGKILARNGEVLAQDLVAKDVVANPRLVSDKALTARTVARLLGLPEGEAKVIQGKLERAQGYFAYLKRRVPKADVDLLERSLTQPELEGVRTEEVLIRSKPAEGVAANLIGWTDLDGIGQAGIEWRYDKLLVGQDGERGAQVDALGEVIPQTEKIVRPARNGEDVVLTIDTTLQQFADGALDRCAAKYRPESAVAIVMDVRTGDVLAMSSYPRWDPTKDTKLDMNRRRIRGVADVYEPGSTYKVIIAASALDAGINTRVYCSGTRSSGKHTIHCAHSSAHGAIGLRTLVQKSCNLGAAQLAGRLGSQRLYEYAGKFRLLGPTGIELKEESYLPLSKPGPRGWREIKIWNVGFGQGIAVSPIQLVAAYAAIANRGEYNRPKLVRSVGGRPPPDPPPTQIISREAAETVCSYMGSVVTGGTGRNAKVKHYTTGGKTGTAQIVENGRYLSGKYVASFIGIVPVKEPRLAILVSVFKPNGARYGGTVAAPVFREIATEALRHLEIPPDAREDNRDGTAGRSFNVAE